MVRSASIGVKTGVFAPLVTVLTGNWNA